MLETVWFSSDWPDRHGKSFLQFFESSSVGGQLWVSTTTFEHARSVTVDQSGLAAGLFVRVCERLIYYRSVSQVSTTTLQHREMHSIARILSPEIVREIYGYIYAPMRVHKLNGFPWHLGQISASWRSIFHSMTSNFWNRLDIDLSVMDKYRDPELVDHHYDVMLLALRNFLDHTRGRPFSFQFKTRRPYMAEEDKRIIRLFELLVAELIRWREINIRVESFLLPILYEAKHHMPLLSSAHIRQGRLHLP